MKLAAKGLDALVINDVSGVDIGFESTTNEVTIVTAGGDVHVPKADKLEIANSILDAVDELHRAGASVTG